MTRRDMAATSLRGVSTQACLGFMVCVLLSSAVVAVEPLTQVQYQLSGIALEVSPANLTVPRNLPTQLNTTVLVPRLCRQDPRCAPHSGARAFRALSRSLRPRASRSICRPSHRRASTSSRRSTSTIGEWSDCRPPHQT